MVALPMPPPRPVGHTACSGERACNAYSVGCAPPRLRGTCGLRLFALLPGEIVPMNKHPQLGAGLASGRRLLAQIDTTKSLGDLSCPTDVFQSAFDGPVRWRTSTGDEPKAYNVRVERFANEMNWCHVGRYLFALNRPGSTTSSQAASRSRIYVSSCDGCTGSSQPVAIGRSSNVRFWHKADITGDCPRRLTATC